MQNPKTTKKSSSPVKATPASRLEDIFDCRKWRHVQVCEADATVPVNFFAGGTSICVCRGAAGCCRKDRRAPHPYRSSRRRGSDRRARDCAEASGRKSHQSNNTRNKQLSVHSGASLMELPGYWMTSMQTSSPPVCQLIPKKLFFQSLFLSLSAFYIFAVVSKAVQLLLLRL